MSTEINTRGMIRGKVSSFPGGNDVECLTKSEIAATGQAEIISSYGDSECPMINHIVSHPSVWFGYRYPDGRLQEVVDLATNPTLTIGMLNPPAGAQNVFIVKSHPEFSNAKKIIKLMEKQILDIWIKLPCVEGNGSCGIDSFIGRVDDYLCYIDFILTTGDAGGLAANGEWRVTIIAYDAASNILESMICTINIQL